MKKYKISHLLIFLISSLLLFSGLELKGQKSHKVLFLGNSYTSANNLPQIIHDAALSVGDTLVFDSYTPGGYRLTDHNNDNTTQSKISVGDWDYVVMQGQSQESILNNAIFNSGATSLNKKISQNAFCSVPMLYITWGRENGDQVNCPYFPEMCTYQGMDTTIRNNYLELASRIYSEVSPVSVVWNKLRQNNPGINLYQPDGSHPSKAGSYAAAVCFYATLFKKDPTLITFDFGLNSTDASIIRNTVKTEVFNNLSLWDFKEPPKSKFTYNVNGQNSIGLNPINTGGAEAYHWDFGDGSTSSNRNTGHVYSANGTYIVTLTTKSCDLQGVDSSLTDTVIQFCSHTPTIYTPNPWLCSYDSLWTQSADSYQWFHNGMPIPDTTQYLPDYSLYNGAGLSVMTTVSGCSELSVGYTEMPVGSEFYFSKSHGIDPCAGDTGLFVVLHNSGSLSGSELIQWYKNDTLLSSMSNEDTLLVTQAGVYEVEVVDSNAKCPLDTTRHTAEYKCGIVGVEEPEKDAFWNIFPNPASENMTLKFSENIKGEEIQMYTALGRLIKVIETSSTTTNINISDLPKGLYYIRIKDRNQAALKFIKQ